MVSGLPNACADPASLLARVLPDWICSLVFDGMVLTGIAIIFGSTILFYISRFIDLRKNTKAQHITSRNLTGVHWDLAKVLSYILYHSRCGWLWQWKVIKASMAELHIPYEFNKGTYENSVHARGRPRNQTEYETVDPTYWRTAQISTTAALDPQGTITRMEPRGHYIEQIKPYDDFLFDTEEIQQIWRKASRVFKWTMVFAIFCKQTVCDLRDLLNKPIRLACRIYLQIRGPGDGAR